MTMTDFSHLKQLEVSVDTIAEYPFYSIDGEPVMIVSPATSANKRYYAKTVERSLDTARKLQGNTKGKAAVKALDDNRDMDRALYPSYVIKGWRNVTDSQGKDVAFSVKNCESFLSNLPDYLFDELRNFAGNPGNFANLGAVEEQSKN